MPEDAADDCIDVAFSIPIKFTMTLPCEATTRDNMIKLLCERIHKISTDKYLITILHALTYNYAHIPMMNIKYELAIEFCNDYDNDNSAEKLVCEFIIECTRDHVQNKKNKNMNHSRCRCKDSPKFDIDSYEEFYLDPYLYNKQGTQNDQAFAKHKSNTINMSQLESLNVMPLNDLINY
jgi:hypothetical protein